MEQKHYVVQPSSSRWRKRVTPQAQRQESLFNLELAEALTEGGGGGVKTLCVCVCAQV